LHFSKPVRTGLAVGGALAAVLAITYPISLGALGEFLVKAEQPARADIAVVLAGDYSGNRITKAGELVRQGYVSKVLVSGPKGFYGYAESDLAVPFVVKKAYPAEWFIPFPLDADSTREEAEIIVGELRRRNVHTFLIVTSDYHSRRAGSIFRNLAGGLEFRVVAAPDKSFRAEEWWKTRPGQKQFALEWMKTIATWIGL